MEGEGFDTGDRAPYDQDAEPVADQPSTDALPANADMIDTQGFPPGEPVSENDVPPPPDEVAQVPEAEAPADTAAPAAPQVPDATRRAKGGLDVDVLSVTDEYVHGVFEPKDSDGVALPLTPHRIAARLKERDGLDKAPSTGAITNTVRRWGEIGFADLTNDHPLTFGGYKGSGSLAELTALNQQARDAKKADKAAQKAAAAPAPAPAAPEGEPDAAV